MNIYLKSDEEIISVIDRLIQTKEKEVNLIVPSRAQIWQSSINLKLLKREADNLGKDVTLVVTDDLGAEMAQRIGFAVKKEKDLPVELVKEEEPILDEVPTFIKDEVEKETEMEIEPKEEQNDKDMIEFLVEELKPDKELNQSFPFSQEKKTLVSSKPNSFKSQMADIVNLESKIKKKIVSKLENKKQEFFKKPKEPIIKESYSDSILKEKRPAFDSVIKKPFSLNWSKLLIAFIVLTFAVAGLVGFLVLPTTEIIITPKTEKVSFDLSVVGSKEISQINEELNEIPLQEIEATKTKSREFNATGEKEISEKAHGTIVIYNEYSSDPQTLVATTRFQSPNGKIFRIFESITVPGAKIEEGKIVPNSIEVEVIADQSGEEYNIEPTDFTIPGFKGTPKYAGFYGRSKSSMKDGYIGKVKIVTDKDIKKAEEVLIKEVKEEINKTFQEQIPTELKIIDNSIKEDTVTILTAKEGDRMDKFTVEIEGTISALLFKEEDLKKLVDLNVVSMISENKVPLSETQQIKWIDPVIDSSREKVSFSLYAEEKVAWKIDEQALKENLIDQSETEVRSYLASQPEIEKAKVSFWPFWVKKIPNQIEKIEIIIDFESL
ncbi:hypothetical protein KKE74_00120 [Patescibacteria group bacterium]|nr:hypothetical protein [Patescibacteria group bacterium]